MNINVELSSLRNISKQIGSNRMLIQGAGGNSSVKLNGTIYIKASGHWLSDAEKKNIFVPLNLKSIIENIDDPDSVFESIINDGLENNLKPSIETTLHALMPHKYVLHVHSINTLSYAILLDGENRIDQELKLVNWSWVSYARPGGGLTNQIKKILNQEPDVLVLQNHGLVVGADSSNEALHILELLEKKLERKPRATKEINFEKLYELTSISAYRIPKFRLSHALALDDICCRIANTGALYPDHVVFLGPGPIPVLSLADAERYLSKNTGKGQTRPVLIVKNIGVVVHETITDNAEEMLNCLANILLRVNSQDQLHYLSEQNEIELLGWDAEEYRKNLER